MLMTIRLLNERGFVCMGRDDHKGSSNNTESLPQTPKNEKIKPHQMKEEISMELAELGNMTAMAEPMTANHRELKERDKWKK